ncbi:uncharacterized protein LOC128625509 isoform X2 [Ictalurus furcatus]|uniref:uncharacterized protein LOC128625509 isoform X2 n=1 Tax=Ictalurus furcatus TaxID=66913 RepID=UPI002350790D|nr:uncharacterized protein LOC128625509 isoform X2 [Ictalurus furcatus]
MEDIRVYSVSVTDEKFPRWIIGLIVPVVVILLVILLFLCIKYQKNAVHQEFIKVSKQLEHVNKLIQQARPGKEQGNKRRVGATEALQKAEEAMKELEQRYRENPKYSEQIKLFCKAKRAELMECSGEEGEGLLMTERGGVVCIEQMMRKMEEVKSSLQQLSGDGAGHLQALEMTRVIAPGEPIDVFLPLTDLVEVSFTASDAVQPSNLQTCTVDKEKIQCSPDYKERASLLNTLQINDGDVSDSGNYIVLPVLLTGYLEQ